MQDVLFRKSLVIGIIILFIGACIVPTINSKISSLDVDEKTPNKLSTNPNQSMSLLTFHTFGKTEEKQCNVNLPAEVANDIYDKFEVLKYMIVHEPKSKETQVLKNEFVEILDVNGLIPTGLSKDYVLSLLNPSWLNNKQRTQNVKSISPLLKSFESGISEKIFYLQQIFGNCFRKSLFKNMIISPASTETAEASFCSISSGGNGVTLPLFLLPRPRVIAFWTASSAVTMVGELLSPIGKGFVAEGAQSGSMLGFTGLGVTYAFPGYIVYGFVGYALYTKVSADSIDFYPPNNDPVISDENPPSGTENIPVSLSELSFRISDLDGDLMDYTVTTEPNIGSGNGNNQNDGVYTVQISGLEGDKSYSWTVSVTDGKSVVEKEFSFFTESIPFDPFDEGWHYRKMITIDHTKVAGGLSYFPVLISVTDVDLRDKAQDDGDDILFMDGVGVAYKLCHEIESFDGSSGKLVAWVRIPNLDNNIDTVFYMYYGNPSCSSQQFPEKVWDSNYIAVYHMDGSDYADVDDSTSNNHDVVGVQGDPVYQHIGKVGFCVDFDDNSLNVADSNDLSFTDGSGNDKPMTIETWVKCDDNTIIGKTNPILSKYESNNIEWFLLKYPDGSDRGMLYIIQDSNGGGIYRLTESALNVGNSGWNYFSAVYNGDETGSGISFILDGNYEAGDQFTNPHYNGMENTNAQMRIGAYYSDSGGGAWYYWHGLIDEVRISNIARSTEWLKTSYNSMNDPSSFFSVGPKESSP